MNVCIIGSGYEKDVATLALEDGIAHRAARKNMQIHSAIILLVDDAFAGVFWLELAGVLAALGLVLTEMKHAHAGKSIPARPAA